MQTKSGNARVVDQNIQLPSCQLFDTVPDSRDLCFIRDIELEGLHSSPLNVLHRRHAPRRGEDAQTCATLSGRAHASIAYSRTSGVKCERKSLSQPFSAAPRDQNGTLFFLRAELDFLIHDGWVWQVITSHR